MQQIVLYHVVPLKYFYYFISKKLKLLLNTTKLVLKIMIMYCWIFCTNSSSKSDTKEDHNYEEINNVNKSVEPKPEEMAMTSCAAYGESTTSKSMMEDNYLPGDYETVAVYNNWL